jgi:lipoprotein NlpI
MAIRIRRTSALAFAVLLAMSNAARPQSDKPACTTEQMEIDPRSVIAPCSEMLERSDLSPQQRGMALFVRGRGHHRSGQVPLAGIDYDQALALIPDTEELWMSRANVFFRLGARSVGRRYLARAYSLNPKNPRVLYMVGLQAWNEHPDVALDLFSQSLAIEPAEPYALLFRAQLLFQARKYDDAFKDIDALIALNSDAINRLGYLDEEGRMRDFHIVALAKRSYFFEQLAQYDRAEQDVDAAVAYRRTADSLTERGEVLMTRPGRAEDALADLGEATRLDDRYQKAFYTKGLVLTRLKRFDEAFTAFDRALVIKPNHENALRMRAKMHQALGRPEAAAEDIANAMLMSPTVMRQTIFSLRHAGYWTSRDVPTVMTNELRDAIQACMIDPRCN